MIALEPAKTPAAKRRDRFFRSRFFVVFRRHYLLYFDDKKFYNPTAFFDIFRRRYFLYFDGRTRHYPTAETDIFRRRYLLYFDGGNRYFPTAVSAIFRRHVSCFFNIKRGGVSHHETPPRKSLEIPFRLKINGDTFPHLRINPKNSDKTRQIISSRTEEPFLLSSSRTSFFPSFSDLS